MSRAPASSRLPAILFSINFPLTCVRWNKKIEKKNKQRVPIPLIRATGCNSLLQLLLHYDLARALDSLLRICDIISPASLFFLLPYDYAAMLHCLSTSA